MPDPDPLPPDISQVTPPEALPSLIPPTPAQPVLAGSPGSRAAQGPPVPRPILANLISGLIHPPMVAPAPGQMARPVSRLDTFETFLSGFLGAMGQGMAAAGHGPGSFGRGLGAAIQAPYAQSLQQWQMGQAQQMQQSQIQQEQSRGQLEQAQTGLVGKQAELAGQMATISIPGMGPITVPVNQLGNIMKGAAGAGIAAQSRITAEQLKLMATTNQIGAVKPAVDEQGRPTFAAYDKQGNFLKFLDKSIDPAMLPKTSSTVQFLPDGNGGYLVQPKSTTTGPVVPNAQGGAVAPVGGAKPDARAQIAAKVPALSGAAARSGAAGPRHIYSDAPGVALNPQTNELVQTTASEAAQSGLQNFQKATPQEFDKYRSAQAQMNDVQLNTSRYVAAASRAQREGISARDYANLHSVMNTRGLYDFNIAISQGGHVDLPLLAGFSEGASRAEKSGAYKALSPGAKDLIDGYFRTVAAVPAYMKALTNVGRFNKEQMDLEIQNIPNPTMDPRDIGRKLGQWNENIEQGASSIPRIKGMQTIRDIRAKYEGNGPQTFNAPSGAVVQKLMQSLGAGAQQ